MRGPNTTQRSWDNYVGDNPIKSWRDQGFYSKSSSSQATSDEYERDPITGELKKKSKLKALVEDDKKSAYEKLQENPLSKRMKESKRESAVGRAMKEIKKGKIVDDNFDEDFYVS